MKKISAKQQQILDYIAVISLNTAIRLRCVRLVQRWDCGRRPPCMRT